MKEKIIIKKIIIWKEKNNLIIKSIKDCNFINFKKNMKYKGALIDLHDFITEEEYNIFVSKYNEKDYFLDIEDYFYETINDLFKNINNDKEIFIEQIFNYINKKNTQINTFFFRCYFAFTKNIKNIYKNIKNIIKYNTSIDFSVLLMGAMFNENKEVYLKVLKFLNKNKINYKSSIVLSSRLMWEDKFYNVESWKHFYLKNEQKLGEEFNSKTKKTDKFSNAIYFLIFYQHYYLHKYDKKIPALNEIYNFMIEQYKEKYKFKYNEFVLIHIFNERLKEINFNIKNLNRIVKKQKTSPFRILMLINKKKQVEEFLESEINKCIDNLNLNLNLNDCVVFFKTIKIDNEICQKVKIYVSLKQKLESVKTIYKRQIKKI